MKMNLNFYQILQNLNITIHIFLLKACIHNNHRWDLIWVKCQHRNISLGTWKTAALLRAILSFVWGWGLHLSSSTKYWYNVDTWSFWLYPPNVVGRLSNSSRLVLDRGSGKSATLFQLFRSGSYISELEIAGFSAHQPSQPPVTNTWTL